MSLFRRSVKAGADERRAQALGLADLFPGAVGSPTSVDPSDLWPLSRRETESVAVIQGALNIIAGRGSTLPAAPVGLGR